MLKSLRIENTKIELVEATKNTVILCETDKLVEFWKNTLLKLRNVDDKTISVGFSEFEGEEFLNEGKTKEEIDVIDSDFDKFCLKLIILEEDNCIKITYPDGDIQSFFISNNIENSIEKCETYLDLWFHNDIEGEWGKLKKYFKELTEFTPFSAYKRSEMFFNDKKKLINFIKDGRYSIFKY